MPISDSGVTADHQPRIEYLDWLRALAAGLVVIGHSQNWLAKGGAIGVSVFFVLSGYLITSILLRDGMMAPGNILRFIGRRIARIYPMYLFQIAVMAAFLVVYHPDQYALLLDALPGLLYFMVGAPQQVGYGIAVLWTLAVEFWFYVTFPVLLYGMLLTGRLFRCLCAGIAISLTAKIVGCENVTLQYYDHFLIGALCAAAIKSGNVPSIFASQKLLGAGFCAILMLGEIPYPGSRGLGWFAESLSAAALTGAIIVAGHARPPTISLPSLAFLGRVSYSTYLMHAVILDMFVVYHNMNETRLALYLPIVLAVSSLTYFVIEKPITGLAQRVLGFKISSAMLPVPHTT
jgi:peptidoglycan/LPS O-acetylase OafA/YrhL